MLIAQALTSPLSKSILQPCVRSIEYYSATTDLWSCVNSDLCMSYTIHYISKEWELSAFALNAIHFPQDHNVENLADAILCKRGNLTAKTKSVSLPTMAATYYELFTLFSTGHAYLAFEIIFT